MIPSHTPTELTPWTNVMTNPTVFIIYSHKDDRWKDRLRPDLKALEQADRMVVWDDRPIGAGEQCYDEIEQAMGNAAAAA